MTAYARTAAVYRELRAILGPGFTKQGYRRVPKSDAWWIRALDTNEDVCLGFRCNTWGGGSIGGNAFHGLVQTQPSGTALGTAINRQADISLCFLDAELDELREIQNSINARRPSFPERDAWMREDSPVGEQTRRMYQRLRQGERPYRVGDRVTFGYYSIEDVRLLAGFLERHLASAVGRFIDGRCATPAPTPESTAFAARLARLIKLRQ